MLGAIPINLKTIQIKMTDPIADYLTRLRNAIKAQHRVVEIPASNLKKEITKILFEQGYILNYKFIEGENPAGVIKVALKYDPVDRVNAIKGLKRASRPGLRQYTGYKNMPRVKWLRYRHPFHFQRRDDQQEGIRAESGRRGFVLRLLILKEE